MHDHGPYTFGGHVAPWRALAGTDEPPTPQSLAAFWASDDWARLPATEQATLLERLYACWSNPRTTALFYRMTDGTPLWLILPTERAGTAPPAPPAAP